MQTVEEFISQKKKADKLDEFNFQKHAENMSAVIQYVMEYFNEYLDPVSFDFERNKTEQVIRKFTEEVTRRYPQSVDFIISYFKATKQRIDRLVEKYMPQLEDYDLYYLDADFEYAAEYFIKCNRVPEYTSEFRQHLVMLIKEHKESSASELDLADMKQLDNNIVDWIKDTYRKYNVNLIDFAQTIITKYSEKYVESVYDRPNETFYYINGYDYRYQENPFDINGIFQRNSHRDFLHNRKGELEMIMMHIWIFDEVKDIDYWAEYVNLCIATGRVSMVRNINVLKPVIVDKTSYPKEINCEVAYHSTVDGIIHPAPTMSYIVRINPIDGRRMIWDEKSELEKTIKNLHQSFASQGVPKVLEILSPYKDSQFTDKEFFDSYSMFEKAMQRYKSMKIVLVNGPLQNRNQREYLVATIEDIARIRSVYRERKFKLRLSIDFSDSIRRNPLRESSAYSCLSSMRSDIICIHVNSTGGPGHNRYKYDKEDRDGGMHAYISKVRYDCNNDFVSGISMMFRDSKPRYFIPEKVKSSVQLEEIVDDLIRGGFCFEAKEASDEQ